MIGFQKFLDVERVEATSSILLMLYKFGVTPPEYAMRPMLLVHSLISAPHNHGLGTHRHNISFEDG